MPSGGPERGEGEPSPVDEREGAARGGGEAAGQPAASLWQSTQRHWRTQFAEDYRRAVAEGRCPAGLAENGMPREEIRAFLDAQRYGRRFWEGNMRAVWERSGVLPVFPRK